MSPTSRGSIRHLPRLEAASRSATRRSATSCGSSRCSPSTTASAAIVGGARTRTGELDDTLIVFTSDNGFFHGEHRIPGGKVYVYEPSIRVPLVLRGPGVPAGVHLRQVVANIDLAPTIVESTNAKAGRLMDGRSLWPILRDTGIFWGRDLLIESAPPESKSLAVTAVHTPRWRYSEYTTGEVELYDLSSDPDELQSVHADTARARIRADLAERLAALRKCAGGNCRQGPALQATARVRGACPAARADVRLRGQDVARITRVRFLPLKGRIVTDAVQPFRIEVPARERQSYVRVHAFLDDGREVTHDLRLPGCAGG